MNVEVISFLFMLLFILADLITGFFYAKISKTYKSSIMRKGLYHKVSEIGIVLLFYTVSAYMFLTEPSIDIIDKFNLTEFSSIYVIINEVGSIRENLDKIRNLK